MPAPRIARVPALLLLALGLVGPAAAPPARAQQASQQPAADAARPTAEALLQAMDRNLQFDTRTSTATMTVDDGKRARTYQMVTYGRGQDEAAIEYLAPEREKGTRMLKQGDQMWLYMPRAERTQKISGHMLRQGMMGSDVSYEDMLAASEFREQYTATVTGEGEHEGRACWLLEAVARDASVTYPRRVMCIDKEHLLPLRQELYALSGMLMKTWTMGDIRRVEGKPVAHTMVIADQVKQGSSTTLTVSEVKFGVALEDEVFSRRWLERR